MVNSVLVIGCGSIGQRHIGNLQALGIERILAFDPDPARSAEAAARFSVEACRSLDDGLERRPGGAVVCTPPVHHIPVALRAIEAGCHVFVEKPLSNRLDGVEEFLAEASRRGRTVCVGYNLRFQAGLVHVKRRIDDGDIGRVLGLRVEYGQYLPDWRPSRDYRQTYTAQVAQGGGIILDGSHELDYARWLCGEVEAVSCSAGRFSDLEMDVEDTAEITLRMKGRLLAQIHLDCVQRSYNRNCKVIGEKGTLLWDVMAGVRRYDPATKAWTDEAAGADPNEMFRAEIAHFLACARGEAAPRVDGRDGKKALEIALAALRSAAERREVTP